MQFYKLSKEKEFTLDYQHWNEVKCIQVRDKDVVVRLAEVLDVRRRGIGRFLTVSVNRRRIVGISRDVGSSRATSRNSIDRSTYIKRNLYDDGLRRWREINNYFREVKENLVFIYDFSKLEVLQSYKILKNLNLNKGVIIVNRYENYLSSREVVYEQAYSCCGICFEVNANFNFSDCYVYLKRLKNVCFCLSLTYRCFNQLVTNLDTNNMCQSSSLCYENRASVSSSYHSFNQLQLVKTSVVGYIIYIVFDYDFVFLTSVLGVLIVSVVMKRFALSAYSELCLSTIILSFQVKTSTTDVDRGAGWRETFDRKETSDSGVELRMATDSIRYTLPLKSEKGEKDKDVEQTIMKTMIKIITMRWDGLEKEEARNRTKFVLYSFKNFKNLDQINLRIRATWYFCFGRYFNEIIIIILCYLHNYYKWQLLMLMQTSGSFVCVLSFNSNSDCSINSYLFT
jgi:hypothetical protein